VDPDQGGLMRALLNLGPRSSDLRDRAPRNPMMRSRDRVGRSGKRTIGLIAPLGAGHRVHGAIAEQQVSEASLGLRREAVAMKGHSEASRRCQTERVDVRISIVPHSSAAKLFRKRI